MSTHFRRFNIMFHAVRKRENSPTTIRGTWDVTVTSCMPGAATGGPEGVCMMVHTLGQLDYGLVGAGE